MEKATKKLVQTYYYTITGDAVLGDNKVATETASTSRFPIDTPQEILTQSEDWKMDDFSGTGNLENIPGIIPAEFSIGQQTPSPSNA